MTSLPRSEPTFYTRLTDGPAFIADRFGSGRGLARLALSHAARAAGRYRAFERIEWARVERLVFVCTGNICRSPYAERRAAAAGFPAISIALRGETGRLADPSARAAARAAGLDLDSHRSTEAEAADLRPGDLLVAMELWQARHLQKLAQPSPPPFASSEVQKRVRETRDRFSTSVKMSGGLVAAEPSADAGWQVTLLGLWTRPSRPHLHDPYTLSDAYFRTCFRLIDSGVAALLTRVRP